MNFKDLLIHAKENDDYAIALITEMYTPLLMKASIVNGVYDEDLFQEVCLTLLNCIRKIKI